MVFVCICIVYPSQIGEQSIFPLGTTSKIDGISSIKDPHLRRLIGIILAACNNRFPIGFLQDHAGKAVKVMIVSKGFVEIQKQFCKHRRSEEHTSELQSRGHLVCRLLLEKKKK